MAVNKYKPHVWVVPEDDANRQLANGFLLHPSVVVTCIDIRRPAGGWARVLDEFSAVHISDLRKYTDRHLVLLIDFDGQVTQRTQLFRDRCPRDVSGRVYLLGRRDEPEPFRKMVGQPLEKIGTCLAGACADGWPGMWRHAQLTDNGAELARLKMCVKPFLFS